jgi:hypothetical protein
MRAATVAAIASLAFAPLAGAVEITECGQVVGAGDVGELRRNLSCTAPFLLGFGPRGVRVVKGGTLNLNGFTVRGPGSGDAGGVGIECAGGDRAVPCTVNGPGEVTGFWGGVNCGGCLLVARDVAFRGNTNGIMIALAGVLEATRVVASDNVADGIVAVRVHGSDLEASRNGRHGVAPASRLDVTRLSATGNGGAGVLQLGTARGRARLLDSTLTGNGLSGEGLDIGWVGRLRIRSTTCGKAAKIRWRRIGPADDYRLEVVRRVACRGRSRSQNPNTDVDVPAQ